MSWGENGQELFHTHNYVSDTVTGLVNKIAYSRWESGEWHSPVFLDFIPGYSETYPVWDAKKERLYFSTSAPLPNKSSGDDLNIWFTDRINKVWSKPVPLHSLNTDKNDMLVFIDENENFYILNDKQNNLNIYICTPSSKDFTTPQPVSTWNSELDEEFVSVYPSLNLAFIQRTNPGHSTEILISEFKNSQWSKPVSFKYENKTTILPYVQRWPMLSPDLAIFSFVSQGLIWQNNTKEILKRNDINLKLKLKNKPLPSKPIKYGEPEVFGGLVLKTNNGITFTNDQKTIYISRYTPQRDSLGRQHIKLFESKLVNKKWSIPIELTINKLAPFEYHPVLSPDNNRLFFNSGILIDEKGKYQLTMNNIWFCNKRPDNTWDSAKIILPIMTEAHDDYASFLNDGTLYFRSNRSGGLGSGDIYMSRLINGSYQTPENVTQLNSALNENDVCIDPKGRFIIFNRYHVTGRLANMSLYLSVKTDFGWTKPRKIEQLDKAYDFELTPTLSPDGEYFFYEVNSNILRVKTKSLLTPDEMRMVKGKKKK